MLGHEGVGALLALRCGKVTEALWVAVIIVDLVGFRGLFDLGPMQLRLQFELFGFPFPGVSVKDF
jgi:hypothetical protein